MRHASTSTSASIPHHPHHDGCRCVWCVGAVVCGSSVFGVADNSDSMRLVSWLSLTLTSLHYNNEEEKERGRLIVSKKSDCLDRQ